MADRIAKYLGTEPSRIVLAVGGQETTLVAEPREFSTGSLGFYAQGKVLDKDGHKYQVGINITLVGSKDLK